MIFGRHKGKKLVSEIKSDAKEECKGGVECSDEDPNDDEMSEKEYVQSKQPGSNFLQLLSDELSNDPIYPTKAPQYVKMSVPLPL